MQNEISGQLNATERQMIVSAISAGTNLPKNALEVGTWLGGGSTVHILRAMQNNGQGHLWGIEADRNIYEKMIDNIGLAAPEALHRFTPLFGFSQNIIPQWLAEQKPGFQIDFAFLDGGNNPMEQIIEFRLMDPYMPVGSTLMAHDAKLRKGKWLVPYLACLDHWQSGLNDISEEGLLSAKKIAAQPSQKSLKRANAVLLKMRLAPVELAAAVTPRGLCRAILNALPQRLARSLSDGRK